MWIEFVVTLSCSNQCMVVIWYFHCSEPVLHYCVFSLSVIGSTSGSMLAPCFDNMSDCSLPMMSQCAGMHCRITLLCSNMMYSLRLRLCYPCPASESKTAREFVRNTTSSELLSVISITAWAPGSGAFTSASQFVQYFPVAEDASNVCCLQCNQTSSKTIVYYCLFWSHRCIRVSM